MKGCKGKEQELILFIGLVVPWDWCPADLALPCFLGTFGSITSRQRKKTRAVQVYPKVVAVCQLCAHFQQLCGTVSQPVFLADSTKQDLLLYECANEIDRHVSRQIANMYIYLYEYV